MIYIVKDRFVINFAKFEKNVCWEYFHCFSFKCTQADIGLEFYFFTSSQKINEKSKLREWNTNDCFNAVILKVVRLNAPISFHLDPVTFRLVENCNKMYETNSPIAPSDQCQNFC